MLEEFHSMNFDYNFPTCILLLLLNNIGSPDQFLRYWLFENFSQFHVNEWEYLQIVFSFSLFHNRLR